MFFFFFFSSRRRHTRCGRDWSSDVCSSDLGADRVAQDVAGTGVPARDPLLREFDREREQRAEGDGAPRPHAGEGEGDAEREEEEEVLDQLGEGGVAGGDAEGPAGRERTAWRAQRGDEDGKRGKGDDCPCDAYFCSMHGLNEFSILRVRSHHFDVQGVATWPSRID